MVAEKSVDNFWWRKGIREGLSGKVCFSLDLKMKGRCPHRKRAGVEGKTFETEGASYTKTWGVATEWGREGPARKRNLVRPEESTDY